MLYWRKWLLLLLYIKLVIKTTCFCNLWRRPIMIMRKKAGLRHWLIFFFFRKESWFTQAHSSKWVCMRTVYGQESSVNMTLNHDAFLAPFYTELKKDRGWAPYFVYTYQFHQFNSLFFYPLLTLHLILPPPRQIGKEADPEKIIQGIKAFQPHLTLGID